ncbi:hypothetical protein PRIPAC_84155 [Pristionchus pacificus]|uniref:Uncharacterized protein n=1 Tax=Pristionchus pacificus TaxID=54126 RepID=A0A2A6BV27_PRIPA|nr:hypothetical protein PRIPAC_84155 [Pristionchus pacificus]|eukprot:PDM69718.1 hypothetical protein PRIPAC_44814 [Pristionchus pacificus]
MPQDHFSTADVSEDEKKSGKRSVEKEDSEIDFNNLHDHLSDLYDDCLLDILTRLDHNDLDEVSTLSKKIGTLSELARSKVGKFMATTLELEQVNHRRISVTMKYEEKYYVILIGGNATLELSKVMTTHPGRRRSNMRFYDATQPPGQGELSELISTHISTCLSRFASQRIDFISISIDDHFVKCFEQLTQISPECMMFRECVTPNLSMDGKERFKSMLIVAKAPRLRINFNNDVSFLDSAFLAAYSESITHADLSIYGENCTYTNNHRHIICIPGTQHKASMRTRFSAYSETLLLVDVKFYNE